VIGRLALALLLGGGSILHAQAIPTASRAGDLQIGVGYTSAKPDYSQQTFTGLAAYADFDFRPHLGVEAEFHKVDTPSSDQSYQMTYEVGGRYFRTYGPVVPYGKAMVGRGDFNYPYNLTNLSYTLYAGGVGADFKIGDRMRLRAEYEVQSWTSFPNGGLTPKLLTFGVAYHFAGKSSYK
jgi:hypothetical protein